MDQLAAVLAAFAPFSDMIIDSYFVVDKDRNVVDYNRAFYSLLPKAAARTAKSRKCYELLELDICKERCIAEQCWRERRHVRLDEINGKLSQSDSRMRFILSAIPILGEDGEPLGAIEMQRNVTDEALVQIKYQEILESEAQERERLSHQVRLRTKELLEANQLLLRVQRELLDYKKGLLA